jgi:tetratricopeptide (TPR) repeat protein
VAENTYDIYKKYRTADDAMGNGAWAKSKMTDKALVHSPTAPHNIEEFFDFSDMEKTLWRLVKIPRKAMDLTSLPIASKEEIESFLRSLVSCEALDIRDAESGKRIIPLEIKRIEQKLVGAETPAPISRKLSGRVFRPDIGLEGGGYDPNVEAIENDENAESPYFKESTPSGITRRDELLKATKAAKEQREASRVRAEDLDPDDRAYLAKIEAAFGLMPKQNHYGLLGVEQSAPQNMIRDAYMERAKEWHPDAIARTGLAGDEFILEKLDALFKRLQTVQRILSDSTTREAYDRELERNPIYANMANTGPRRAQEAMMLARKAEVFFKKRDYDNAESFYKTAGELDREDPKLQIAYAWSIYLNVKRDRLKRTKEAHNLLLEILDQYADADSAFKLGLIAKNDDKEDEARRRFATALELDPEHTEALKEKRLFEMRARRDRGEEEEPQDEASIKGMFNRLLKR